MAGDKHYIANFFCGTGDLALYLDWGSTLGWELINVFATRTERYWEYQVVWKHSSFKKRKTPYPLFDTYRFGDRK